MKSLADGKDLETVVRIVRPDGTVRHMRSMTERVRDSKGRVVRSLGIDQDITDSVLAQQELSRTRALLQAAIEQTPAGIIIADAPNGRVILANPAALTIRGIDGISEEDIREHLHLDRIETYHRDGTPYRREELLLGRAVFEGGPQATSRT